MRFMFRPCPPRPRSGMGVVVHMHMLGGGHTVRMHRGHPACYACVQCQLERGAAGTHRRTCRTEVL